MSAGLARSIASTMSRTYAAITGATAAMSQQRVQFNQSAALLRARSALAGAGSAQVNGLVIGHSMAAGYTVTSALGDMFHQQLAAELRRRLGLTGGLGPFQPITLGASSVNPSITGWPVTNASQLNSTGYGLPIGTASWLHASAPTQGPIVFAIPAGHTHVGIWTSTSAAQPAGTFSWQIDAGATNNVDTSADGQVHFDFKRQTIITLPDSNAHTLTLTGVSAWVMVASIVLYNGDSTAGIRVFHHPHAGFTSSQYLATDLAQFTTNNSQGKALAHLDPAFIYCSLLVNDYTAGSGGANPVPSATSITNLSTILETLAGYCTTRPSIILGVEWQRNNLDGSMTEPWANYIAAAYTLANSNGYAVHEWGQAFGGGAPAASVAAGVMNADTIHPTTTGARLWARSAAQFILP